MKNNTYIIPAIDFYVVFPRAGYSFTKPEDVEYCIKVGMHKLIPFKEVDGLLISELFQISCFSNGFAVCPIAIMKTLDEKHEEQNFYNRLYILKQFKENAIGLSKTIDKIVEETYERNYRDADSETRRLYNCFFERYQDGDYETTKQRVKRLLNEE